MQLRELQGHHKGMDTLLRSALAMQDEEMGSFEIVCLFVQLAEPLGVAEFAKALKDEDFLEDLDPNTKMLFVEVDL